MRERVLVALLLLAGLAGAGWLPVTSQSPARPEVRIAADGPGRTLVDITIPGLETREEVVGSETYTAVSLAGEPGSTMDVGLPGLPRIVRNLALPDDAGVQVEVVSAEYVTVPNVLVYPWQKPTTDHDRFDFSIDRGFYALDRSYPVEAAAVERRASWRGLPFASVGICPVEYNPARRELRVATRMRVRLSHTGTFQRHQIEPWAAQMAARFIDNLERYNLDAGWLDSPGVRYLVIAHSNHAGGWLDSLVNWHTMRGIETRVIAKSSWTATEVRDSITAEYNRNTPKTLRWALLVGEYNEVPGYAYPGVGYSDFWYGDVAPPAGDDYQDVGIGRFSPSDAADLGNQIQKTLKFQKAPTVGAWTTKSTLAAHSEQYPGKYSACSRGIYNFPYALYRYTFDTVFGGAGGTNAMVSSDINEGRVVVNYRGHGSETDWSGWDAGGQSWTAANINALTNGDLTPVVFNCCCLNHVLSTGTCLGEAWMRKYPGGAVASLGATEASYTIPNHGWDSTLYRCLGDTYRISVPGVRDYVCPVYDLGGMLSVADAHIVKYHGSIGVDNAHMYLWLGDPALMTWVGPLVAADVTYPPTVPLGSYDLGVTVMRSGAPVRNALVCARKQGEFYVFGYTDASGNVTLPVNATSPGNFSLTVTAQGITPHLGTILARTTGTPYVTYLRSFINDSIPRGNGDGCVNPGEQIVMPVWVKNHGDSVGLTVTGKLRVADGYVTLTDSAKAFGNIPAHDSAYTGPAGFGFTVAPACTNGHTITFTLQCRDSRDSVWNSRIYVRVGAPYLRYAGQLAVDTIAGGNNNGRIDPSEAAELMVGLQNTGFGHANGVTAKLRSGDGRMVITDSVGAWGQIPAESTKLNGADRFRVQTLAMPPETDIPCTLHVTGAGGYSTTVTFVVRVGEIRQTDPIPDGPRTPAEHWAYDDADVYYNEHPTYNWVEIRGVGTRLTLSDDQTVTLTLPVGFGPWKFYGQSYTQVSVCSNGWIAPGSTTTSTYTNTALPSSAMPPAVFVNWDDIYPPAGGGVWYYHDAANHRYVVEWDSVRYYSGTNYDKYQIIVYDSTVTFGDNEILLQYHTISQASSSTVGMQDHTRTVCIQALFDNSYHRGSSPIQSGRAVKFSPDNPDAVEEPGAGIAGVPDRLRLRATPSLFRSRAQLSWQVPTAGGVRLTVYDVLGREVRTLVSGERAAGAYITAWDGRDSDGRAVASGTYLYKLVTASGRVTARSVLVR